MKTIDEIPIKIAKKIKYCTLAMVSYQAQHHHLNIRGNGLSRPSFHQNIENYNAIMIETGD